MSAEWREESGRQNAVVGSLGRVFDLIVVEHPDKLASFAEATLEDALFESGRPVLMAPATPPAERRRARADRLERLDRDRAHRRLRHAVPEARQAGARW